MRAAPPLDVATAIAPPARQTKSAECAPITSSFLLMRTRQPPRLPHDHLAHLVLVEPPVEQAVGPEREPVLDGRIVRVSAVAREERALDADRPHAVEDVLPRRLAAEGSGQAALDEAATRGERPLVVDREVLTRELRVRDDDVRDALLERPVDDRERVVASEVARGEDQVVARDRPQHVSRLGQEPLPRNP